MIRLNGKEAFVPQKQRVQYSFINPHLLYDSIPGTSAQIPTFPAVRQNKAIFDYWEEPQAGNYLPELLYEHFHNGELIKEGYFLLTEAAQGTGYKGSFTDKLGLFFGDMQNLSLREIEFGALTIPEPLEPLVTDELGNKCCFPTIVNESFYGTNGASVSYSGLINDYAGGPVVPQFFVTWVIKKIAQVTGTTIKGSFFDHTTWNKLILINLREAEGVDAQIKNHLPDMTIAQFLLELRKVPNLRFDFNTIDRTLTIGFWEPCLTAQTERNWTGKAIVGETKTPEINSRVQLRFSIDGNDALAKDKPTALADYLSDEIEGNRNGIAPLDIRFSTLLVDDATGLPVCKQEGQTSLFAQDSRSWAPRLLFWHGEGHEEYPLALPHLNGQSLYLTGENGLANTTWKETIALRQRQFYLQKDFFITEADIAKLDLSKKYHVQGVDYLIAQMNVTVPVKDRATALLIGGV